MQSTAGVILALLVAVVAVSNVSARAGAKPQFDAADGQQVHQQQYHHYDESVNRQHLNLPESNAVPSFRQLAFLRTATTVKIVTTTIPVTSKSLCASLVNVTGACQRRRRGVEDRPIILSFDEDDHIDLYNPTAVQAIEPTADPATMSLLRRRSADGFLEGSQFEDPSSRQQVEVDISGLPSSCMGGVAPRIGFSSLFSLFGITIRRTETIYATVTSYSTTTSGSRAFFVSACTPNPFLYNVC